MASEDAKEDAPGRPDSPFLRAHSTVEDEAAAESAAGGLSSKFAGLTVETAPTPAFEGRDFRAGIMIVGKRIRGGLKKKSTSGFRMFKDKYYMLHNGKMLQFDSEKHYMSGFIPSPDDTTYINLYDLDEMEGDKKFSFRLVPKKVSSHTRHTLYFRAQDQEAKDVWLDSLKRVPDLVVMTPTDAEASRKRDAAAEDAAREADS